MFSVLAGVVRYLPSMYYLADTLGDKPRVVPANPTPYKEGVYTCPDDSELFVRSQETGAFGNRIIYYNNSFKELDNNLFKMLCDRECFYIKGRGRFIAPILAAAVNAGAAFSVPFIQSYLPSYAAPLPYLFAVLSGHKTYSMVRNFFETRADEAAIKNATDSELKTFAIFLASNDLVQEELKKEVPLENPKRKVLFGSKSGFWQSPLARLKAVENELQTRSLREYQDGDYSRIFNYVHTKCKNWVSQMTFTKININADVNL